MFQFEAYLYIIKLNSNNSTCLELRLRNFFFFLRKGVLSLTLLRMVQHIVTIRKQTCHLLVAFIFCSLKDRNGMDLTEAENIKKRWQEYTEEL